MKLLIIGLSGKKGVGKDAAGESMAAVANANGWYTVRRGFGDAVKDEVAEFLGSNDMAAVEEFLYGQGVSPKVKRELMRVFMTAGTTWWKRVKRFFCIGKRESYWGLEWYVRSGLDDRRRKEHFRFWMQWWGTEYRRKQDPIYWEKRMRDFINEIPLPPANEKYPNPEERPVLLWVPDNRFPNEQEFLLGQNAFTVRLNRPHVDTGDTHPSETALDDCRTFQTIINQTEQTSLEELRAKAAEVFAMAMGWRFGSAPL
jgi:hypothetical protein